MVRDCIQDGGNTNITSTSLATHTSEGLMERGRPAAFDITVTSPLCPAFLGEASQVAGTACSSGGRNPQAQVNDQKI